MRTEIININSDCEPKFGKIDIGFNIEGKTVYFDPSMNLPSNLSDKTIIKVSEKLKQEISNISIRLFENNESSRRMETKTINFDSDHCSKKVTEVAIIEQMNTKIIDFDSACRSKNEEEIICGGIIGSTIIFSKRRVHIYINIDLNPNLDYEMINNISKKLEEFPVILDELFRYYKALKQKKQK